MSKSIMHSKASHTCYLCMALHNDHTMKFYLEEHHVFGGNPNRRHSEHYGLKVYLCPEHHRTSDEAVHRPDRNKNQKLLQAAGQREFKKWYPGEDFVKIFGKNYCEEGKESDRQ